MLKLKVLSHQGFERGIPLKNRGSFQDLMGVFEYLKEIDLETHKNYCLWYAVRNNMSEVVPELLTHFQSKSESETLFLGKMLASACKDGKGEIAEMILSHPTIDVNVDINRKQDYLFNCYRTPLNEALISGQWRLAQLLIDHPEHELSSESVKDCFDSIRNLNDDMFLQWAMRFLAECPTPPSVYSPLLSSEKRKLLEKKLFSKSRTKSARK
uniref:Uncharacterized protein n=1 Tax=Vannella robusta TaxID=1487602 RepID=A0A7S4MHP8_9EUKA|mmetsp:Transcript_22333/g.28524  ORF Transcript_22333/g.28524 Transcript_22333/m.28524 type:complete len:212 (+) Transcript_22333:558-1193(+)